MILIFMCQGPPRQRTERGVQSATCPAPPNKGSKVILSPPTPLRETVHADVQQMIGRCFSASAPLVARPTRLEGGAGRVRGRQPRGGHPRIHKRAAARAAKAAAAEAEKDGIGGAQRASGGRWCHSHRRRSARKLRFSGGAMSKLKKAQKDAENEGNFAGDAAMKLAALGTFLSKPQELQMVHLVILNVRSPFLMHLRAWRKMVTTAWSRRHG